MTDNDHEDTNTLEAYDAALESGKDDEPTTLEKCEAALVYNVEEGQFMLMLPQEEEKNAENEVPIPIMALTELFFQFNDNPEMAFDLAHALENRFEDDGDDEDEDPGEPGPYLN
jgi:hypothetical protein